MLVTGPAASPWWEFGQSDAVGCGPLDLVPRGVVVTGQYRADPSCEGDGGGLVPRPLRAEISRSSAKYCSIWRSFNCTRPRR